LTLAPQLLPAAAAAAALLLGPAAAAAAAGCDGAVRERSMVRGLLHTGQDACKPRTQQYAGRCSISNSGHAGACLDQQLG
jgi:hypothetical protein